jgi:hypothetical protein
MTSNVDWLRSAFERFNQTGELEFDRVHPNVELHERPEIPDRRVWHGPEGFRAYLAKMKDHFDPVRWEPREFTEAGRHVLVDLHVVGYGASSGVRIELEEHQLWTFDDEGLVVRVQGFATAEDAYGTARRLDEEAGIEPVTPPARGS